MTAPFTHFNIRAFMGKVTNDFLGQQENWCDLRHFQFSNGFYRQYAKDHYSRIYMEQYYLLKFFPFCGLMINLL